MKTPKTITVRDIPGRDYTRGGVKHTAACAEGQHADVIPGVSVRLYGVNRNHVKGPQSYDVTFKLGETAEYDSYNLSYYGAIVAISAKTITIREPYGSQARNRRLTLSEFNWRNFNFDVAKESARNSDTLMYI